MQAVHVFAQTSSEAEMVQANPALQEAVAVMRRTGWLDADSCPSAYAIEQLVSIADRCHAQRTLLGGAAVAWPLAARAQEAGKIVSIGILAIEPLPPIDYLSRGSRTSLRRR